MTEYCEKCGEELDRDCFGELRCPQCDPPCPGCCDGPGPGPQLRKERDEDRAGNETITYHLE